MTYSFIPFDRALIRHFALTKHVGIAGVVFFHLIVNLFRPRLLETLSWERISAITPAKSRLLVGNRREVGICSLETPLR